MRKLRGKRGETLTETLVAILIVALSAAILAVMTATSARISGRTHEADLNFYQALSAAEAGRGGGSGRVVITADGTSETVAVEISGEDGGLTSYRLEAAP